MELILVMALFPIFLIWIFSCLEPHAPDGTLPKSMEFILHVHSSPPPEPVGGSWLPIGAKADIKLLSPPRGAQPRCSDVMLRRVEQKSSSSSSSCF